MCVFFFLEVCVCINTCMCQYVCVSMLCVDVCVCDMCVYVCVCVCALDCLGFTYFLSAVAKLHAVNFTERFLLSIIAKVFGVIVLSACGKASLCEHHRKLLLSIIVREGVWSQFSSVCACWC